MNTENTIIFRSLFGCGGSPRGKSGKAIFDIEMRASSRVSRTLSASREYRHTTSIKRCDQCVLFVVEQILRDIITPLQSIKKLCENRETLTSPEVQATVSTAIDQFQSSTSILMDTVASTLTDTVELFQKFGANAKEKSLFDENGFTKVPGKYPFTSALIYALETLVNESENGRFTTVALLNKFFSDAPHFPKEQNSMLFQREEMFPTGHIMLHPLQRVGSDDDSLRKETFTGPTLTLHYDFDKKPSQTLIELLGKDLNQFFQGHVGINRVRWGGLSQPLSQVRLKRQQRALEEANPRAAFANTRPLMTALGPVTPPPSDQYSLRITEPAVRGSPAFNSADISTVSLIRPLDSNDEDEGQVQEPKGRRKRRRTALHGRRKSLKQLYIRVKKSFLQDTIEGTFDDV